MHLFGKRLQKWITRTIKDYGIIIHSDWNTNNVPIKVKESKIVDNVA